MDAKNQWTPVESDLLEKALGHMSSCAHKDNIYYFGGGTPATNTVYCYHTKTNNWDQKASFQTPRMCATAFLHRDSIYLLGGITATQYLKTMEIYHIESDSWSAPVAIPTESYGAQYRLVEDKLYIFGGFKTGKIPRTDAYVYDLITGAWEQLANMPTPYIKESEAAYYQDALYVFGGALNDTAYDRRILRYDIHSNDWEFLHTIPQDALVFQAQVGNDVYLLGGADCDSYRYSFESDTYQRIAQMNFYMHNIDVADGRIYSLINHGPRTMEYYDTVEIRQPTPDPGPEPDPTPNPGQTPTGCCCCGPNVQIFINGCNASFGNGACWPTPGCWGGQQGCCSDLHKK